MKTVNDSMIGDKSQKRGICYCDKHVTIQYGLRVLPYINLLAYPWVLWFLFLIAFSKMDFLPKLAFIFVISVFLFFIPVTMFVSAQKKMLKADHSARCSRRVAMRRMLYFGEFSVFAIVEDGKGDGSEFSAIKKSRR